MTRRPQYDAFAEDYAAAAASSAYNALYDRPAILDLAGSVDGLRVLELGCAAGHLSAELAARGAHVTATDVSAGMIAAARRRFGDRVEFRVADAAQPLAIRSAIGAADGSVDLVVASLLMHYLRDWGPTLRELRRVLVPGGRFVMSVHHPTMDWLATGRPNYFATRSITELWKFGGRERPVTYYRRPLHAVFAAVREAGFDVLDLAEPMPVERCRTADPKAWERITTRPRFLYLVAASP